MLTTLVILPLVCCATGYWTLRSPSPRRFALSTVVYVGALALVWTTDEQSAALVVAIGAIAGMWLGTIPDEPDA